MFVPIRKDLVISVAERVRKFVGSNFHPAPFRVPLMNRRFHFFIQVSAPDVTEINECINKIHEVGPGI